MSLQGGGTEKHSKPREERGGGKAWRWEAAERSGSPTGRCRGNREGQLHPLSPALCPQHKLLLASPLELFPQRPHTGPQIPSAPLAVSLRLPPGFPPPQLQVGVLCLWTPPPAQVYSPPLCQLHTPPPAVLWTPSPVVPAPSVQKPLLTPLHISSPCPPNNGPQTTVSPPILTPAPQAGHHLSLLLPCPQPDLRLLPTWASSPSPCFLPLSPCQCFQAGSSSTPSVTLCQKVPEAQRSARFMIPPC